MTKEQKQSFKYGEETHNNESNSDKELFEMRHIEGTPFTAVKMQDQWFLSIGKYRLTEKLKSFEECVEDSKDASWFRMMQIMKIMIEEDKKETVNK